MNETARQVFTGNNGLSSKRVFGGIAFATGTLGTFLLSLGTAMGWATGDVENAQAGLNWLLGFGAATLGIGVTEGMFKVSRNV